LLSGGKFKTDNNKNKLIINLKTIMDKETKVPTLSKTAVSGSINELLSKFENGLELYRNNAVFANCIEHLVRGGDIYKIFEQIIIMQSNTQEKLTELITSGVLRQEIIVSKEKYDELASGL
jgi:hypothetical protein